jgi:hypothetical protein
MNRYHPRRTLFLTRAPHCQTTRCPLSVTKFSSSSYALTFSTTKFVHITTIATYFNRIPTIIFSIQRWIWSRNRERQQAKSGCSKLIIVFLCQIEGTQSKHLPRHTADIGTNDGGIKENTNQLLYYLLTTLLAFLFRTFLQIDCLLQSPEIQHAGRNVLDIIDTSLRGV